MSTIICAYIATLIGGMTRNKYVHHFLFILLALFFSTRNDNVPDTENYIYKFNNALLTLLDNNIEIGLSLLCFIFNDILGFSFSFFLFFITLFLFEVWYFCTRKLFPYGHIGYLFILFLSHFGFFYFGIVLGNCISLIICYSAFVVLLHKKKHALIQSCILIIIATLFHKSSILFFAIIPLIRLRFPSNWIIIWFVVSISLLFTSSVPIINKILRLMVSYSDEYSEYENYESNTGGSLFNIIFLMEFVITLVALYGSLLVKRIEKVQYESYLKLIMFGFSLYCIFWSYAGVTRISGLFFFYSSIILYMIIMSKCKNNINLSSKIQVLVVSVLLFAILLYSQSGLLNY